MKSLRVYRSVRILSICGPLLTVVLAGCGGGGGGGTPAAATLKSIAISPSSANIARGGTQQFTATGTFSDNSTKDITATCVWMSSNTAVVTINSSGLATAVNSAGVGQTANITCSQSGVGATTASMATVAAGALTSITVTGASSVNVGATTPAFTATGNFSDGSTLTLTSSTTPAVSWSSSNTANATIDPNTGVATGRHSGTANIVATSGSIMGSAILTVGAVLSSIAISPSPAVSIPQGGTVNFSASATFNDGTTQANFTTSCSWASSNATAVTMGASTGVAMVPTHATVGASSNITCSATVPAGTPTVTSNAVVATVTAAAFSELNGHYAFLLNGFDPGGHAVAMAGSFTADGNGNISGGIMEINDASSNRILSVPINPAPASFYSVGADNRGQLTLDTSAGPATFDFALGSISSGVASLGHVIGRQYTSATNGSAISGVFKKQDTSAFTLTALTGDFTFLEEGRDNLGHRIAAAGRFTLSSSNGVGTLNGVLDRNANGFVQNNVSLTGSLASIDTTNGRVFLTTIASGGSQAHYSVYIISGSEMLFITTDAVAANPLLAGSVLRQSTTFCPSTGACNFATNSPSPLNGTVVAYFQGNSSSCLGGSLVQVGDVTFTPGATAGTGTLSFGFDTNDCGSILPPSGNSDSGTYSAASNGRVTVTLTSGHPAPILYMVDTNHAFLIGTDTNRVEAGVGEPQVGPIAFGPIGTPQGQAFGDEGPAMSGSVIRSGVDTFAATSSTMGNISNSMADVNSIASGLQENVSGVADTTTLDPATGRFIFGLGTNVGYFIRSTRRVMIKIQTTENTPTIIVTDNQ